MPETVEISVFRLGELDDHAKIRARDWYRQHALEDHWYDTAFDDFENVCGILGIELKANFVRLLGGGLRQQPCIYFSGFSSQGDDAFFEGRYTYRAGSGQAVRSYAGKDTELHRIADTLMAIQRRNFYQLTASVSHRGRYFHECSMEISVERTSAAGQPACGAAEDLVVETLRDVARWLYRQLEAEFDYQRSDDVVDEAILANDFRFTQDGSLYA